MAGKIFINYRRGDDPGHTGRLFDRLQDEFEPQQLFLDVDNIAPGLDFIRVLDERVAECDVLLAVIGKGWIDARDAKGNRRLDEPDDFVRIEIASALTRDKRVIPVLVGDARMPRAEELPEDLRPLAWRNAVRLTHERFRADTQGLVKALRQGLEEIEALRQEKEEAERGVRAEEERRRQEAEAARRAEEEELKRKIQIEERERAEEQRRQQEDAIKQRAEETRAFAAAKSAGSVLALDAFLAVHPGPAFADEARKLKAALLVREEAYGLASASDDPAVLKSFLATFQKGADVDQIRGRLRLLEPRRAWHLRKGAIIIPGALALVAIVSALAFWVGHTPLPSHEQRLAPTAETPRQPSASAVPVQPPPVPAQPPPVDRSLKPPPKLRLDEIAWSILKDTTDEADLRRFVAQYPDSIFRKDAEERIAALEAARSATPVPPSPEQIAWDLVKDSKDPDELRRFIEEFPHSAQRALAEQRIAALSREPANAAANPTDRDELTRMLQFELKRVGCFNGRVTGEFDDSTKAAWHRFIKLASIGTQPDDLSPDWINAVRGIDKRVCPLACPHGKHAEGESCIANVENPPARPRHAVERASPPREPTAQASPPRAAPIIPCGKHLRLHRLPGGGCGY